MLTLDLMNDLELTSRPVGQMVTGWVLRANYRMPLTRTRIVIEGLENLPRTGRIYLAMNHTDRFNYWPFQVELWRSEDIFTATWVKGKYFNNELMGKFLVAANNIPAPSKGYVITVDANDTLGHPPSTDLYRVLRTSIDEELSYEAAAGRAEAAGVVADFRILSETARDILSYRFEPSRENFVDAQRKLFHAMMERFVELNYEAFEKDLKILVFPEGTRSRRLSKGRPGLAQMALRTRATVVPIGCNGSDELYPGNSPISRGGTVVYRIGEPLTPEGALAPFQIEHDFQPFTTQADAYVDQFDGFTDVVMNAIEELLDPRYRSAEGAAPEVEGAKRFL